MLTSKDAIPLARVCTSPSLHLSHHPHIHSKPLDLATILSANSRNKGLFTSLHKVIPPPHTNIVHVPKPYDIHAKMLNWFRVRWDFNMNNNDDNIYSHSCSPSLAPLPSLPVNQIQDKTHLVSPGASVLAQHSSSFCFFFFHYQRPPSLPAHAIHQRESSSSSSL